jgi:hypothetical protein
VVQNEATKERFHVYEGQLVGANLKNLPVGEGTLCLLSALSDLPQEVAVPAVLSDEACHRFRLRSAAMLMLPASEHKPTLICDRPGPKHFNPPRIFPFFFVLLILFFVLLFAASLLVIVRELVL